MNMNIKLKKINNLLDIFEDFILMLRIQHPNSSYERIMKEVDDGTVGLINFRFDCNDYSYLCNDFWYNVGIANERNTLITYLEFDIFLDFENRDRVLNSIRNIDTVSKIEQKTTWVRGKRMYSIRVQDLNTTEKIKKLFDIIFEGGELDVVG